jgi:hypothetical protein
MAGVDELLRRGYVDAKRLGVTGGSGGGLLTKLDDRADRTVRRRRLAALDLGLGRVLVLDGFHTLHPVLVPQVSVSRSGGVPAPFADHVCRADHDAVDADRRRAHSPVKFQAGDTLEVRVDSRSPVTVTFTADDFTNLTQVTAAELAAKVQRAIPGVIASDDAGGLLIESATTGPESRVEITGGSACAVLGFPTDNTADPCHGRPVLGVSFGPGQMQDPSILALRRCNDCGSNECLARTLEAIPAELHGSYVAEHRRIVNTLAEHCKDRGWSHPDLAAHHAAETEKPLERIAHNVAARGLTKAGRSEALHLIVVVDAPRNTVVTETSTDDDHAKVLRKEQRVMGS